MIIDRPEKAFLNAAGLPADPLFDAPSLPLQGARTLVNTQWLMGGEAPPSAHQVVVFSMLGPADPAVQAHLARGGTAVVYEEMSRSDPEPRTEHWIVVHQGEVAVPVVSMLELCVQHGQVMLDRTEVLLAEVSLMLLAGHDVWSLRARLLPERERPASLTL